MDKRLISKAPKLNIARLRQKLEDDPKEPRFITTRIGIGYMFLKSR